MSVKSIWSCTFCKSNEEAEGTYKPKWWNDFTLETFKSATSDRGSVYDNTQRNQIHLCPKCSNLAANIDKQESFWNMLKDKLGIGK